MSLLKYIQRLERIHLLIKRRSTGNIDDFAKKMGLSRRQLLEELSDLKQLGAPIKFENASQSYIYENDWHPLMKVHRLEAIENIKGGAGAIDLFSLLFDNYLNKPTKPLDYGAHLVN